MKDQDFRPGYPGRLARTEGGVGAFIPNPLSPEIPYDPHLTRAVADAQEAIGRLDSMIPESNVNPYLLVYPLMKREAYYSSLMEGTYTTPTQMALFPEEGEEDGDQRGPGAGGTEDEQTREVFNYVNAMKNGLRMVREQQRTIHHGMILELHRRLMSGVRGRTNNPGSYRSGQNFVGRVMDGIQEARFVPPPPQEVRPLMDDLIQFITRQRGPEAPHPYPVGLALIHYQFETIHPFEDGNGRIGRLMIPILLTEGRAMREPLLHISPYLERRREEYKDRLLMVSQRGEWKEWIDFFLETIRESAMEAAGKVKALLSLRDAYIAKVRAPRSSMLVAALIESLFKHPSISFNEAKALLKITHAQAAAHVRRLEVMGILEKAGDGRRNARYVAREIVDTVYK